MIILSFPVYNLSSFADSNFYINQHYTGISMHSHNYIELVFVPSGKAESLIENSEAEICEGNYFFIDYHTNHCYKKKTEDFYVTNCLFHPQFINSAIPSCDSFNEFCKQFSLNSLQINLDSSISNRIFNADDDTKQLFRKIWNEYTEKSNGYTEIIRGALCEIIIKTIRKMDSSPKFSPLTFEIIKAINSRYKESVTLNSLCKELHYSPSYASTVFRAETKLTFTQYLQNIRIKESCLLLSYTDLKIGEIAENVGYNSIKSFNLLFKSLTNITPREYRKISKKIDFKKISEENR